MCILRKHGFQFIEIPLTLSDCRTVAVDLHADGTVRLVCVYASPSKSADLLRDRISAVTGVLDEVCACSFPIVILGDFSLPLVDWIFPFSANVTTP